MTDDGSPPTTRRTIASEDLRLAVWEGPDDGPTLVFVHGFPDTHTLWDPVISRLCQRFHCVSYDVRGAGSSDAPPAQADYALPHLITDLVAVMDAVSPDDPVHLVGHDWGSVQAWEAVLREKSDGRLAGRIASYTTISGPSLHHVREFRKAALRGGLRRKREAVRQLLDSWYVFAFHLPVLPELALRRVTRRVLARRRAGETHFAASLPADAVHGVNLYRANIFHTPPLPGPPSTALPVQLVVLLRDRYVTPALTRDLGRFAHDLTRVEIEAGHWAPRSRSDQLAGLLATFVTAHPGGPESQP